MTELGELLELLYGARKRYRTARGVFRRRYSSRLVREAMKRENERRRRGRAGGGSSMVMLTSSRGPDEEPPDLQEEETRFWFAPPGRLRDETTSLHTSHTTVLDGDLWWMYMPDWGVRSNAGLGEDESSNMSVGGGEPFRLHLDPSGLPGVLEIEQVVAEGDRLLVRARPRDDLEDFHRHVQLHTLSGADRLELVVDAERGVVLRLAAFLDGEELSVAELVEIVFDEDFPDETFVFVPPPGEEILPPETSVQREYTLEEAAALVGFRVFEIAELPEGPWRVHVHYIAARTRPPMPANLALFYHRANGRGTLIVSQRPTGEGGFGWSGIYPDGPPLEELERDGVGYTVIRGDPKQGNGASVAFDRDGTAIQLQSQELDVDALLDLAGSLRPVE